MGEYVRIAETHEIPNNNMKVFKVENHEILVINIEGELYAFENRCPHMGYPPYFGRLEGKVLTCGFHYAKFDLATGKSLGSVTDKSLKKFKIRIQNTIVEVEL